jgi:hypothetical protein
MDIILLGTTVVSLAIALVMSTAAWRLTRDEKKRSAARVAALSLAANSVPDTRESFSGQAVGAPPPKIEGAVTDFVSEKRADKPFDRAPWSAPRIVSTATAELPLNQPARIDAVRTSEPTLSHASGFLGATAVPRENSSRQKTLALAAVILFLVLSGGLVWSMSGPRGTTAVAMGPNAPLELVSLSHERRNNKLAVSGLVRNPVAGHPIDHLAAVVFLFDRMGTFITSSRANVDFVKLGAGDESPFVVSLDAPATVARYRVSFRTDEGIVPHIDRRGAATAPAGDQPVNVSSK